MQYLYDDVIPPFRFFTKIVMGCLNDALDKATPPRPQEQQRVGTFVSATSVAADKPPLVEIPPGLVTFSAMVKDKTGSVSGKTSPLLRNCISAVFVGYDVTLCGFTDGRVKVARCSGIDGRFEIVEIPPFASDPAHVVTLNCVPFGESQIAVAVGYSRKVYVCLVSPKRGDSTPVLLRKKIHDRIIEINAADWSPDGSVSLLQLSPCLKHIAMTFDNGALVAVAALPSLKVPRQLQASGSERLVLETSSRVAEDNCLTHGSQGHVFFMPEQPSLRTSLVSLSTIARGGNGTTMRAKYPLCLIVWVGSNNYSRCPLGTIGKNGLGRLNAASAEELPVVNPPARKSVASITGAIAPVERKSKGRPFSKSGDTASRKRCMEILPSVKKNWGAQSRFDGLYRGMVFGQISAAAVASADGAVVALGFADGRVLLMDGHGITSMLLATSSRTTPSQTINFFPFMGFRCNMALQVLNASLFDGQHITLAHARGVPSATFTKWATVRCLHGVEGLRAVLSLGELPLVLVFCEHNVYLWDVQYNCVVASLVGLPPLEPFALQKVACQEGSTSASRRSSTAQVRNEVYLPLCTESAVVWWTSNGTLARLLINDLLGCVYPLLRVYFAGLAPPYLAFVLEHVPPFKRDLPEHMEAVELPTERPLSGASDGSALCSGSRSGNVTLPAGTAKRLCSLQTSASTFRPEVIAAGFLETTRCSVSTRSRELHRMLELWRQK